MNPKHQYTGDCTYDIVAATFRRALADTRSKDEKIRQDAIAWLDIVAPDWQKRVENGRRRNTQKYIYKAA